MLFMFCSNSVTLYMTIIVMYRVTGLEHKHSETSVITTLCICASGVKLSFCVCVSMSLSVTDVFSSYSESGHLGSVWGKHSIGLLPINGFPNLTLRFNHVENQLLLLKRSHLVHIGSLPTQLGKNTVQEGYCSA